MVPHIPPLPYRKVDRLLRDNGFRRDYTDALDEAMNDLDANWRSYRHNLEWDK